MVYDRLGSRLVRGSIVVCTFTHQVFVVDHTYTSNSLLGHICVEGMYLEGVRSGKSMLLARVRSGDRTYAMEVIR